ncbi:conserved hypothetical protein [Ricinus communis]|uniref:Isochorismatase-like domain-containing protein n=1 Tax=Ricinus communis TaxID=3988 RepID=B9TIH9_RICCO|nr:conserved hypothetical protein [Ricinus communis]
MMYEYEILDGVLPVSHYVSDVMVQSKGDAKTVVTWKGSFKRKDLNAAPAAGQDDESAVKTITGVYRGAGQVPAFIVIGTSPITSSIRIGDYALNTQTTSLRDLVGLGHTPSRLSESALILIDCQNTYRQGIMRLDGVEEAILEAQKLLDMARQLEVPIVHIRHDGGAGTPYDVRAEIGAISDEVAPKGNEVVITKHYPNSFFNTELDQVLKSYDVQNIVLAGFMTHMCVNSTAHGGFNLGYRPTVVASATATRALENSNGNVVPAQQVQDAALAATRDLYAAVVGSVSEVQG